MFIPNINSYIDPDDSVIFLESISRRQESFAKKTLKLVSTLDCPPETCKDQGSPNPNPMSAKLHRFATKQACCAGCRADPPPLKLHQ